MNTPDTHTLYIKHMVCQRCIDAVSDILGTRQIETLSINLGKAEIYTNLQEVDLPELANALIERGFELIEDK